MNIRNFIGTMLSATAGFAILPGAELYQRLWKPTEIIKPEMCRPVPDAYVYGILRKGQLIETWHAPPMMPAKKGDVWVDMSSMTRTYVYNGTVWEAL